MMNQWIAQLYGTPGAQTPAQESTVKLAHGELFAKLAADNNIDLSQLRPDQVEALYNNVFPKTAQENEGGESKEHEKAEPAEKEKGEQEEGKEQEKKEAAAVAYWQEKHAQQEKFAEADLMGRVMAHAFVQELEQIKQAQAKTAGEDEGSKKDKEEDKKEDKQPPPFPPKKDEGEAKEGSAAVPAQQKTAGAVAFDELAAYRAIDMAKEAGYNGDEAFKRINAVFTLGLNESTKIASVQSPGDALHIRALEFLEKANYPVNWQEVLGS